jgi:enoyl-CoA hydratase
MSTVRFEIDGPVATLTLDRPQARNAVDRATADELLDAFRRFESEDALSVAVLTGAGGHFCAGADLKAFARGDLNHLDPEGDGALGPTRLFLSKPTIAAVEGYAVAGGLELALLCDLRVASRAATFGVFCRRWGVPLIDGGTVRLPRLIGMSHALDLILTGRAVDGAEAHRIGLANRLVEPGGALQAAQELARELAALPQDCLRSDRRSAFEQWGMSLEAALRNEAHRGAEALASPQLLEGIARFSKGEGRHGAPSARPSER